MTEPFESMYFSWLCAKVNRVEVPTPSLTYLKLLRKLHRSEFVWLISGDDNRAEDGLELRDEFLVSSGVDDEFEPYEGCSVLEMFISFSRRAEFMAGETPNFWFWLLIDNLELSFANDAAYNEVVVHKIIYDFVWRLYDDDGKGGLFPLNNSGSDQRKVEIWYQFCEWLEDTGWPL